MPKPATASAARPTPPDAGLEVPSSWLPANRRRVQLLRKRRTKSGLSPVEAAELRQFQELTRRYLDAKAPVSFDVIEDLKRAVEEAGRHGGGPGTKAG